MKKVEEQKKTAIDKLEADLEEKGFEKLDRELIQHNPPKIKWGEKFEEMEADKKIDYLKKLAATMNHAASLIQDERNKLNELMALKEEQLEQQEDMMVKNHEMLHKEMEKINAERQKFNERPASLKGDGIRQMLNQLK